MDPQLVDFTRPTSPEEAATLISVSWSLFSELINPTQKVPYYKVHHLPKRRPSPGSTHREVWECTTEEIAVVHKIFARRLHAFIASRCAFPSPIAHGYVPGRSTVSNAKQHVQSPLLLRIDIANFFNSIMFAQVEALLKSLGIENSVATALAELSTLDAHLPLGLHASPVIANFACLQLDNDLTTLASGVGATVTRYADDITFSGSTLPTMNDVVVLLSKHGFSVSSKKCRLTKLGQAHYVTGLSVSDHVPRLPRRMKRRMRQEMHFVSKYGLAEHFTRSGDISVQSCVNRLDGMLRYFNGVEPALAARLTTQWEQLMARERVQPAYSPLTGAVGSPVTIFVDETVIPSSDGDVLAIAMCWIVEMSLVRTALEKVIRSHTLDPFSTGDKQVLDTRGLHFTENHPDLQTQVFQAMEVLPIRSFIAYDIMPTKNDYQNIYAKLLISLLKYRLMSCDGSELTLVFEENPSIPLKMLDTIVRDEFDKLVNANDRRPTSPPTVRVGTKQSDLCLATADYTLAGFRNYALIEVPTTSKGPKKAGEQAQLRFDRLRDRIRVVLALPIDRAFGRRRPFQPWPAGRPSIAC